MTRNESILVHVSVSPDSVLAVLVGYLRHGVLCCRDLVFNFLLPCSNGILTEI